MQHIPPKIISDDLGWTKGVFTRIVFGVGGYATYFICKKDCARLWGFSSVQKCTALLRSAYGAPPNAQDIYLLMSALRVPTCLSGTWQCLSHSIWQHQMQKIQLESWYKMSDMIFCDVWEHRLHALESEEFSICLPMVDWLYKDHTKECSVILKMW
jgi:hypothetical protein